MSHVVTNNCRHCRYTECVACCPVSCFHANDVRVYIDPRHCTDCGACLQVCPVEAIVRDVDIEPDEAYWITINAEAAERYPVIHTRTDPLPGADAQRTRYGFK